MVLNNVYLIRRNVKIRYTVLKQALKTLRPTPTPTSAADTSKICWVVQYKFSASVLASNFAASMRSTTWVFHKKGFVCWKICFLRTNHGSPWLDTLIVITVEYGVLKKYMHSIKLSKIVKDWSLICSVSKTNCRIVALWGDSYCGKLSKYFDSVHCCAAKNERVGWLQQDGKTAHTAETAAFLQGFLSSRIVGRGLWPPRSSDLTPPDFFLWWFIKQRI